VFWPVHIRMCRPWGSSFKIEPTQHSASPVRPFGFAQGNSGGEPVAEKVRSRSLGGLKGLLGMTNVKGLATAQLKQRPFKTRRNRLVQRPVNAWQGRKFGHQQSSPAKRDGDRVALDRGTTQRAGLFKCKILTPKDKTPSFAVNILPCIPSRH